MITAARYLRRVVVEMTVSTGYELFATYVTTPQLEDIPLPQLVSADYNEQ